MNSNRFVELDVVNGNGLDLQPEAIMIVEGFEDTKNDNFPEAAAFVKYIGIKGEGHAFLSTSIDSIGHQIMEIDPSDFFEIINGAGNRMLVRRTTVTERASIEDDQTLLSLRLGAETMNVIAKHPIKQIRAMMSRPTMAEPPENMQPVALGDLQHDDAAGETVEMAAAD